MTTYNPHFLFTHYLKIWYTVLGYFRTMHCATKISASETSSLNVFEANRQTQQITSHPKRCEGMHDPVPGNRNCRYEWSVSHWDYQRDWFNGRWPFRNAVLDQSSHINHRYRRRSKAARSAKGRMFRCYWPVSFRRNKRAERPAGFCRYTPGRPRMGLSAEACVRQSAQAYACTWCGEIRALHQIFQVLQPWQVEQLPM